MRTIRSHPEAVFEITLEISRLDHRLAEIAATVARRHLLDQGVVAAPGAVDVEAEIVDLQ